ncbi:hypothetical protein D3C81_1955210 [compost metagenome]
MRAVNAGDNDGIGLCLSNHSVELMRLVDRNRMVSIFLFQQCVGIRHSRAIDIAEADDLRGFKIIACNLTIEKFGAAAGAYKCIFPLAHCNHSIAYCIECVY